MRNLEELYSLAVYKELNIDFAALKLIDEENKTEMLSHIRTNVYMNIVARVNKIHPYAITHGTAKDPRWYTYVKEEVRGERRKIR